MNVPSTVSFRNLTQACEALREASGASLPDIIDYEIERIIEKCIAMTPAAKVEKINANAQSRQYGVHATSYAPKYPKKGYREKAQVYKYSNRFPDELWKQISEQRAKSIAIRLANRGISKQSWLKLAEAAGLNVKAPAFVKKVAVNIPSNFSVRRVQGDGSYSINFRNAQPTVNRLAGDRIVQRAIQGRAKYTEKNIELGVFDEFERIAKAYPGLTIKAPAGRRVE